MVSLPRGEIRFTLPYTMTSRILHCLFLEPREKLFTGEQTALHMLLNGISLSNDVQNHINGFIGEEPEHPYMCEEDDAYVFIHDDLNNEYVFPIDKDEKSYFEVEFEDDFVVNDIIYHD